MALGVWFEHVISYRAIQILDALIDQGEKSAGVHERLAPFFISTRTGFGGDNFFQRFALLLECSNFVADFNQHVPEKNQVGLILRVISPKSLIP